MVNVITQLFKYMVALIMAIYTIRCFTVFSVKKEKKKRRIYRSQNFLMLWIHLMLYTIIFLNERETTSWIIKKLPRRESEQD